MTIHRLVNRYTVYSQLVGEVRFMRQRAIDYKSAAQFSPQFYGVTKDEFLERAAALEDWLQFTIADKKRWYKQPLYNSYGRIVTAFRRDQRRLL